MAKPVTEIITVQGERWAVPHGFKAAYMREAQEQQRTPGSTPSIISDLLGLIGYEVPEDVIKAWPLRKRVEALVYAGNVHLRASDNPLPKHPNPDWLPEPWQGEEMGGYNKGTKIDQ